MCVIMVGSILGAGGVSAQLPSPLAAVRTSCAAPVPGPVSVGVSLGALPRMGGEEYALSGQVSSFTFVQALLVLAHACQHCRGFLVTPPHRHMPDGMGAVCE